DVQPATTTVSTVPLWPAEWPALGHAQRAHSRVRDRADLPSGCSDGPREVPRSALPPGCRESLRAPSYGISLVGCDCQRSGEAKHTPPRLNRALVQRSGLARRRTSGITLG